MPENPYETPESLESTPPDFSRPQEVSSTPKRMKTTSSHRENGDRPGQSEFH